MIVTSASLALMALIVVAAGHWWNVEAADYGQSIFKAAPTTASLSGAQLDLHVANLYVDAHHGGRHNDDYLLDHGKIMHLYAIREPGMDAAFHLHPTLVAAGGLPTNPPAS